MIYDVAVNTCNNPVLPQVHTAHPLQNMDLLQDLYWLISNSVSNVHHNLQKRTQIAQHSAYPKSTLILPAAFMVTSQLSYICAG